MEAARLEMDARNEPHSAGQGLGTTSVATTPSTVQHNDSAVQQDAKPASDQLEPRLMVLKQPIGSPLSHSHSTTLATTVVTSQNKLVSSIDGAESKASPTQASSPSPSLTKKNSQPASCGICGKRFASAQSARKHVLGVHRSTPFGESRTDDTAQPSEQVHPTVLCPVCYRPCASIQSLCRHVETTHSCHQATDVAKAAQQALDIGGRLMLSQGTDTALARCRLCHSYFPSTQHLFVHIEHLHGLVFAATPRSEACSGRQGPVRTATAACGTITKAQNSDVQSSGLATDAHAVAGDKQGPSPQQMSQTAHRGSPLAFATEHGTSVGHSSSNAEFQMMSTTTTATSPSSVSTYSFETLRAPSQQHSVAAIQSNAGPTRKTKRKRSMSSATASAIAANFRECLAFLAPPHWTMSAEDIANLSVKGLSSFPLKEFLRQYREQVEAFVASQCDDVQVRKTTAQQQLDTSRLQIQKLQQLLSEATAAEQLLHSGQGLEDDMLEILRQADDLCSLSQ